MQYLEASCIDPEMLYLVFDMFDLSSQGSISHSEIVHFLKHVLTACSAKNEQPPISSDDQDLTNLVHQWFADVYQQGKTDMDIADFSKWIKTHPELIDYIKIVDEFKIKVSKV
jgi:Ca2+-binding EF-hand superfamily protein